MRLSDWRARAPAKDALAPKVVDVITPVLVSLGADADPGCWVVWGDDPSARYLLFVPSAAGLLQVAVRVNVPQEGPRASGKLIRWGRVSVGELAMEMADGHRLLSFQVEGQVLKGTDADADAIAAFALELFAAIDGRPFSPPASTGARTGATGKGKPPIAAGSSRTGGRAAGERALALPAPRGDGS